MSLSHEFAQIWRLWQDLFVGLPLYDQGLPLIALLVLMMGCGAVLKRMFEN